MHEFFNPAHRHLKLDSHRIIDPETGDTLYHPGQEWLGNHRNHEPPTIRHSKEYFRADKHLGALPSAFLIEVAQNNLLLARANGPVRFSRQEQSGLYDLAGSALIEAAFSQLNETKNRRIDNFTDERLGLIDIGLEALSQAKAALGHGNTSNHQRLQLKLDFHNVYKDIICRDLTSDTVGEIRELLQHHSAMATANTIDAQAAAGLGGEIRALQYYWDSYEKCGDEIAIPSTPRGGDGNFNQSQTHDLDILRQKRSGNWEVTPFVEVKRRRITKSILGRYIGSRIMHITRDRAAIVQEPAHNTYPAKAGEV